MQQQCSYCFLFTSLTCNFTISYSCCHMTLNSKSTGNNNILRGYILPCILTGLFGVIVAQFAEMKIKTLVLLTVVANCFRKLCI